MDALETKANPKRRKFVAWCLRLKTGSKSAQDAELERAVEWLESFEVVCGAIVAFGILLEFVLAWLHPPYDSALGVWGGVVADAMVGVGVLGEVMAGARVTICQGELTRRANERLGLAEERAADAQLETEKLRAQFAWRNLVHTQILALSAELRKGSRESVLIHHLLNDPESQNLAQAFGAAFKLAGWGVSYRACSYSGPLIFETRIPVLDGNAAPVVSRVHSALTTAGVPFVVDIIPPAFMHTEYGGPASQPWALIYIGPKPMPVAVVG